MKQIWAPWRMPYLRGEYEKVQGCIFCDKIAADDAAAHVLYRGRHCFVMLNRFPYSNGHLMIAPYAHVDSLTALDAETLAEMMRLVQVSIRILNELQQPEGFNVGINEGAAAGAGVAEHLHMHVVPRWAGDANYMTTIGETRVIPQMLDETYKLLRPAFEQVDNL